MFQSEDRVHFQVAKGDGGEWQESFVVQRTVLIDESLI